MKIVSHLVRWLMYITICTSITQYSTTHLINNAIHIAMLIINIYLYMEYGDEQSTGPCLHCQLDIGWSDTLGATSAMLDYIIRY